MTKDINYYQYTCIDEASRERYLYWYEEHSAAYLKRSNRIPMAVLGYLTPKEKREELKKA